MSETFSGGCTQLNQLQTSKCGQIMVICMCTVTWPANKSRLNSEKWTFFALIVNSTNFNWTIFWHLSRVNHISRSRINSVSRVFTFIAATIFIAASSHPPYRCGPERMPPRRVWLRQRWMRTPPMWAGRMWSGTRAASGNVFLQKRRRTCSTQRVRT